MGLISKAFHTASSVSILGKVKDWVWERVEPKVSDYVRSLDADDFLKGKRMEGYADLPDEDRERYEEAGKILMEGFDNLSDFDNGDPTIDMALLQCAGNIAEGCKDDPAKLAYFVDIDGTVGEKLVERMDAFNDIVDEAKEKGEELNTEDILGMFKEAKHRTSEEAAAQAAAELGTFEESSTEHEVSAEI